MGESRDANDPRDLLKAMNKEAREEFEGTEATDSGGQEHVTRADRAGEPEAWREAAEGAGQIARSTEEQDESKALRVPRGEEEPGTYGRA